MSREDDEDFDFGFDFTKEIPTVNEKLNQNRFLKKRAKSLLEKASKFAFRKSEQIRF